MSRVTPARSDAHAPHRVSVNAGSSHPAACGASAGTTPPCCGGTCTAPATDCACQRPVQDAPSSPRTAVGAGPGRSPAQVAASRSRPPRGRAAWKAENRPRERTIRRDAARRLARALASGRRRAAERVVGNGYAPHPGWRNFIDAGWRVVLNQLEALRRVDALVAEQGWRSDKRAAWSAILHQLVRGMDWQTGLVAALTAQRLGDAGDRATRTVSRVIAWARDIGLLVVIEHGASAAFLGTEHGRTPTYALVTNAPLPYIPDPDESTDAESDTPSDLLEPETGDPSLGTFSFKPLTEKRLERRPPTPPSWPVHGVPKSAPDRSSANRLVFQRLGLDSGGVSGVPLWRTRALLRRWWDAGVCPKGLLWAIEHHPDRPDHHRGDAFRGARDPLRVLAARLRPWDGRLHELPAAVAGFPADYREQHARQLADRIAAAAARPAPAPIPTRTPAQVAARAAFAADQAAKKARRRAAGASGGSTPNGRPRPSAG